MIIIFMGPPGAGKGTQASAIVGKTNLPHISTGDIFRANLKDGTPLGLEAKKYMESGALVPDKLAVQLVADRLAGPDARKGALLDGFPRTMAQAEALAEFLDRAGRKVTCCLSLEISDATLLTRLSGRRMCRNCGARYHTAFAPPLADGCCDRCGGEIYQRDDDREEIIKNRLDVFHRQTNPLTHWYEEHGLLKVIDGEGPVEDITNRVFVALGV